MKTVFHATLPRSLSNTDPPLPDTVSPKLSAATRRVRWNLRKSDHFEHVLKLLIFHRRRRREADDTTTKPAPRGVRDNSVTRTRLFKDFLTMYGR